MPPLFLFLFLAITISLPLAASGDRFEITLSESSPSSEWMPPPSAGTPPAVDIIRQTSLYPIEEKIATAGVAYPMTADISELLNGQAEFVNYVGAHPELQSRLQEFYSLDLRIQEIKWRYFAPDLAQGERFGTAYRIFHGNMLRYRQRAIVRGLLSTVDRDAHLAAKQKAAMTLYLQSVIVGENQDPLAPMAHSLSSELALTSAQFLDGLYIDRYLTSDRHLFYEALFTDLLTLLSGVPTTVVLFKAPLFIRYPLVVLGISTIGRDLYTIVTTFHDQGTEQGVMQIGDLSRELIVISTGVRLTTRGLKGTVVWPFSKLLNRGSGATPALEVALIPEKTASPRDLALDGIGNYTENRISQILAKRAQPHYSTGARVRNAIGPLWNRITPKRFNIEPGLSSPEKRANLLARIGELEKELQEKHLVRLRELGRKQAPTDIEFHEMTSIKKTGRGAVDDIEGLKKELSHVEANLSRHEIEQALGPHLAGREQGLLRALVELQRPPGGQAPAPPWTFFKAAKYRATRSTVLAATTTARNLIIAGVEHTALPISTIRLNPQNGLYAFDQASALFHQHLVFKGKSEADTASLNRFFVPLKFLHKDFLVLSSLGLGHDNVVSIIADKIRALWPDKIDSREIDFRLRQYFKSLDQDSLLARIDQQAPSLLNAPDFYQDLVLQLSLLRKQFRIQNPSSTEAACKQTITANFQRQFLHQDPKEKPNKRLDLMLDHLYNLARNIAFIPNQDNRGGTIIHDVASQRSFFTYVAEKLRTQAAQTNRTPTTREELRRSLRAAITRQFYRPEMAYPAFDAFCTELIDAALQGFKP